MPQNSFFDTIISIAGRAFDRVTDACAVLGGSCMAGGTAIAYLANTVVKTTVTETVAGEITKTIITEVIVTNSWLLGCGVAIAVVGVALVGIYAYKYAVKNEGITG